MRRLAVVGVSLVLPVHAGAPSPFPRRLVRGLGRSTGPSCVRSSSIPRIRTQAASTAGSTSAPERGRPCARRWPAP